MGGSVNWTEVLVVGVPAMIAALGSALAAILAAMNRRSLRTPSGDSIGHVVERTHDIGAVTVSAVTGANGPVVQGARKRLNGDLDVKPEHA